MVIIMKLSKIQNFVIIALVIATVVQTVKLWLYDNDGHNFFYTVFADFINDGSTYSGETYILEPSSIITGYGNKKFSKFYCESDNSGIYDLGNDGIKELFSKGEFLEKSQLDWDSFLISKCLIFKYSQSFNINDFETSFGKNKDLKNDFNFNSILIYPQMNYGSTLKISFVDLEKEESYNYKITSSKVSKDIYDAIEKRQNNEIKSDNQITYISTKQSGFNIFYDNVFVPQWTENQIEYSLLKRINPFEQNGDFSVSIFESYIDDFFDNSTSKWSEVNEQGGYLFSDDNTVVKYSVTGLLEYFNYKAVDENVEESFIKSYSAAKNFIKSDNSLKTDIYLENWYKENDEYIFCFNYTVNNMPLIPSDILKEMNNLDYCIEISVKNNSVRKYRRIAYNYEKENKTGLINKEFIKALDETVMINYQNSGGSIVTNVDDIKLAYYMSGKDSIKLRWFTTINNNIYSVSCEK